MNHLTPLSIVTHWVKITKAFIVGNLLIVGYLYSCGVHRELTAHIVLASLLVVLSPSVMRRIYNRIEDVVNLFQGMMVEESLVLFLKRQETFLSTPFVLALFLATGIGLQSAIFSVTGLPWLYKPFALFLYKALTASVIVMYLIVSLLLLEFLLTLHLIATRTIEPNPFGPLPDPIFRISNVVFEVVIIVIAIYILLLSAVWAVPWGNVLLLENPFGRWWALPIAIGVFLYSAALQFYVYRIKRSVKLTQLREIDKVIGGIVRGQLESNVRDEKNVLDVLFKWREILLAERIFYYDAQNVVTIVGGVVIPLLATLFQR